MLNIWEAKHLVNIRQDEVNIPEWLYKEEQTPFRKKVYNPQPLKQTARDNINTNDKELDKELV